MKQRKGWGMGCDVDKATEGLENELWRRWTNVKVGEWAELAFPSSQLILQPFRCFTYVIAQSPTLPSLLLRHRLFTYVTWRAAHGRYSSEEPRPKRLLPEYSAEGLVVSKTLSLNLNLSFLNWISVLLISSCYSVVLTRLDEPHSRACTSRIISRYVSSVKYTQS